MRILSVLGLMSFLSVAVLYAGSREQAQNSLYQSEVATKITSANVATSSVVVVPRNSTRKGFVIYNNSANSVYITYGPTSNGSTCTRILATFANFESMGPTVYTGEISAIRNAGTGSLIITEIL